jgi:hypothetical protein
MIIMTLNKQPQITLPSISVAKGPVDRFNK